MSKPWNDYKYFRDAGCDFAERVLRPEMPRHIVWLDDIKQGRAHDLAGQNVYIIAADGAPCYWRPDGCGYTGCVRKAGIYTFEDAYNRTSHCGPEKRVGYSPAPMLTETQALDEIAHVIGTHPFAAREGWGQIQTILLRYHNQSAALDIDSFFIPELVKDGETQQRTEIISSTYWTCSVPEHRHGAKDTAERCIKSKVRKPRTTNTWTPEAKIDVARRHQAGETFKALSRVFGVSESRMRQVALTGERLQRFRKRKERKDDSTIVG
jgi:hypothetical protein